MILLPFDGIGSLLGAVVTMCVDKPCGAQSDALLLRAALAAKAAPYPK